MTQVSCPTCKKIVVYEECATRPFCSERCKLIDLGQWASESFKISGPSLQSQDSASAEEGEQARSHEQEREYQSDSDHLKH